MSQSVRSLGASSRAASLLCSVLLASSLSAALQPREARAHGDLPSAQHLLIRNDEMYVPTPAWGIFVRRGGEWRWICDEALNENEEPRVAVSSDGQTLYATNLYGLTLSPDRGCSWIPVSGTLQNLVVLNVVADPVVPARAYALAIDFQGGGQSGLWKTEDRGQTWTLHLSIALRPAGVAISSDGQKLAVTAVTTTSPVSATLYEIGPTGPAQSRQLTLSIDGQPLVTVAPLQYENTSLYLRTQTNVGFALHRLDGATSMTPTRLLAIQAEIVDVARAPQGNSLVVATREGLYREQPDTTFMRLPTLSTSPCLLRQGDTLYSCAWNYAPDKAAIAQLGADLTTYTKVFRYSEPKGPLDCPANTAVGMLCPAAWATYSFQLEEPGPMTPPDMSTTPPAMDDGCSCDIVRTSSRATPTPTPVSTLGLLAGLGLLAAWRRRRRSSSSAHRAS